MEPNATDGSSATDEAANREHAFEAQTYEERLGEIRENERADLDMVVLFFRQLTDLGGAELSKPLIRYLKLTEKRRSLLLTCPELAAAVVRLYEDSPDVALRLGLV